MFGPGQRHRSPINFVAVLAVANDLAPGHFHGLVGFRLLEVDPEIRTTS
jgi:hypothetical protein